MKFCWSLIVIVLAKAMINKRVVFVCVTDRIALGL